MDVDDVLRKLLVSAIEPTTNIDFGDGIQRPCGYLTAGYIRFDQGLYDDIDITPSPTEPHYNFNCNDILDELEMYIKPDIFDIDETSNSSFESIFSEAATTQSPSPKFTPKPDHEEEEDEEEEEEAEEEEEEARTTDEDEIPKIKQEPLSPGNPIRRRKTAIGSKQARKRRTRKNLLKPGSQLYQFILQLLDDKDKEQFIRWVRQSEGVFRIVKKEEVAKLWGEFKNRRMSYDSLSRGLRHYYQQGLLNSVSKKLHYQFTKKALDYWNEIRDKDSIEEL